MGETDSKKEAGELAPLVKDEAKEAKKPPTKKAAEPAPPAALEPVAAKYRVLEDKRISWRGALTLLRKDKVLSETHYGKDGIEHLLKQGVKLEPVK